MSNLAFKKWAVRTLVVAVLVGIAIWFVSMARSFLSTGEKPRQIVHNISLIKQPPPPPPKPPEKPPEPPKVREVVKLAEPKPAEKPADNKPPSDKPLGVDAKGGPGSDNFGLAGRIGGKDLLATGAGGGAYYTGLIQRLFYEALMRDKKIQKQDFRVVVKVELGADGKVERANLIASSGNKDLDQQIEAALADVPPLKEVPPSDLREVEIRLTNRT